MKPIPFPAFRAEVLDLYRLTRAPKTAQRMAQVLDIAGSLPRMKTTKGLTLKAVTMFAAAAAESRHPNTVATLLSYLRRACNHAVRRGYLNRSPFAEWPDLVKWVPSERSVVHTPRTIGKVLASLAARSRNSFEDGRLHAWACVLAHTGMRRDEALNLHERDLDLVARTVTIRRRLKRATARRTVPLTPELARVLRAWLPRRPAGWLFPGVRSGKPWRGGPVGRRPHDWLRLAGEAAGVMDFTPHTLRHSFATAAATLWDVSPATLQGWLGHTSIKTTMRFYVHLEIEHLQASAIRIGFPAA